MNDLSAKPVRARAAILPCPPFQRILVGLDFSEESRCALQEAASLASQSGASLSLVHVVEPVFGPPDVALVSMTGNLSEERMIKRAGEELRELETLIPPACRVVETAVRCGIAFFEITEAARALGADLIVIGTHGRTGLERALLGSTAEKIVRHAPCPVLVMREKKREVTL